MSLARALAGQSGNRERKREGGENGDRERKGGDRAQQQAAGREGRRAGKVEGKRKAGRAGDVEDKRGAGQSSGLARGAAARRRRGQDDSATISATANIRGRTVVCERATNANSCGLPGNPTERLHHANAQGRRDCSAGYVQLVRAAEASQDGFDEPGSLGSPMEEDDLAHNPIHDFPD